ncbi:MAG: tellurite methyltransferase [Pseudohongiellaceae bacterium]|jgi:tellurite methyltransferase
MDKTQDHSAHTILAEQLGLPRWLASTDIYLVDQIVRGKLDRYTRVLDGGCGAGRNMIGLAKAGLSVRAVDRDQALVLKAREALAAAGCRVGPGSVSQANVDALPFDDASFDLVICSAVLHFAQDVAHFDKMVCELWRVLAPGGLLFTRLASSIGIEGRLKAPGKATGPSTDDPCRRYRLPDGTDRFLVDEAKLLATTAHWNAELADPIKTTNVQGKRCMTTWCVGKPES